MPDNFFSYGAHAARLMGTGKAEEQSADPGAAALGAAQRRKDEAEWQAVVNKYVPTVLTAAADHAMARQEYASVESLYGFCQRLTGYAEQALTRDVVRAAARAVLRPSDAHVDMFVLRAGVE